MLKKLLSSIGIGGATVDLQLQQDVLVPGSRFLGQIVVKGGEAQQQVAGLTLALMTRAEVETDNGEQLHNHVIESWRFPESFSLAPKETRVIPLDLRLSGETPLTELPCRNNRTHVWLQTGLEIDLAVDPGDRDFLRIVPTPAQTAFLAAMERAGLQMLRADVEKGHLQGRGFRSRSGCYQEIEYRPAGAGRWRIREVEVSFVAEEDRTHVLLEMDRTFSGDGYVSLTLDHRSLDVQNIVLELERLIR